jgi:RHS repeat-associated protein
VVLYYVHADHLNTPRLVTDTSNNIRWRWDSDAFGTTVPDEDPSSMGVFEYHLRFPGQQYDAVVGLHYNYFRDYDPSIGRYVQSDPIGLQGGLNPFLYADASPVDLIDEDGLQVRPPRRNYRGIGGNPAFPRMGAPMQRPANFQPIFSLQPSGNTQNACYACFNVYHVVRVTGSSRGSHRDQGNRSVYDYLTGPNGPTNANYITRDMLGPNGALRNPRGFEWHHPRGRPNEIWLIASCQHRGDIWQGMIHPSGSGGYSQYYGQ